MAFDSLGILAALTLFCACVSAWLLAATLRPAARLYLRFASMLFAALGVTRLVGLADAAGLFLLPLGGASLMVAALALFARPPPVFAIAGALVIALAGGLAGLVSGVWMLALAPVVFAGLAIIAASLNGIAAIPILAGVSLLAAGLAFLEQGAQAGMFLFCAAALVGLAKPSALAVQKQRHAGSRDASIRGFH
ncbi:MAG: hypothetical protein WCJ15_02460 [Alphaproteobacteria bacterium]